MKKQILEHSLIDHDLSFNCPLIGVDEVGRGALAGPVYAGAVHFPDLRSLNYEWLLQVNDSKKLKASKRIELCERLKEICFQAVGFASCTEINALGIVPATLLAMERAVLKIIKTLDNSKDIIVLVDGISRMKNLTFSQQTIIKGDSNSLHIAAASIIAKTARDAFMSELGKKYQVFDWGKNMGYGTKKHCLALLEHGATSEHRIKFIRKIFEAEPCPRK